MFCITLSTLVWGVGGKGPIYFVSACQMMLTLEFFPRVLSKIVGTTESRKNLELKFIFQIGTLNPHGINEGLLFN